MCSTQLLCRILNLIVRERHGKDVPDIRTRLTDVQDVLDGVLLESSSDARLDIWRQERRSSASRLATISLEALGVEQDGAFMDDVALTDLI